jgi:hypothetical protein
VYAFLNIAASHDLSVKRSLFDKDLVIQLIRLMKEDKLVISNVCSYFFTNWLFEADENIILKAV